MFEYTNARRSGRTNPGMIEMLTPDDPRVINRKKYVTGRAARRASDQRVPIDLESCKRPIKKEN